MKTVWDRKNKKWVNVPQSWVDSPDFEELFSFEKPGEDVAGEPAAETPVVEPVKASTRGKKNA